MKPEHRCEVEATEHFATMEKPFYFEASGLSNVFLVGVKYWVCGCGNTSAEIPSIIPLMMAIARSLVYRESALNGEEIRFLRKRLAKKAADFAQQLRITPEHLSKLENGHLPIGEQTDALVRLVYAMQSKDEVLQRSLKSTTDNLLLRDLKQTASPARILAKVRKSYWDVLPTAA